ncbi:MAG: hypothetical protein U0X76_08235 [Bacteroidia bacterium]
MKQRRTKVMLFGPMPPPMGGVSVHLSRLLERSKELDDLHLSVCDLGKRKVFSSDSKNGNEGILSCFLKADIIHIHYAHPLKVVIGLFAKICGKKLFYTQHNIYGLKKLSTKLIIALSNKVICVSQQMAEKLPVKNSVVIPAYIPSSEKSEPDADLKALTSGYKNVFTAISSHSKNHPTLINGKDVYGFDLAVEAMSLSNFKEKSILVLIDPAGVWEKTYTHGAIQSLNESASLLYWKKEVKMSAIWPLTTIFLRPTRSDGDALSIREAIDAQIPVIASNITTRPQGVVLFDSDNPKSLSEKLQGPLVSVLSIPKTQEFYKEVFSLYL